MMFTNERLKKLIIPLVIEQMLAITMGMVDTMMVASCGEAAVSGISLVDSISVLLIGLFNAMAMGGAVVVSQLMGRKDKEGAAVAANQLFLAVGGFAAFLMGAALISNQLILHAVYGEIEAVVKNNARVYFYIMAVSYPFLGIYGGAAALFRAVGNSRVSMKVSVGVNLLNVGGNALLIYVFRMGVAGAGLSTLVSRVIAAVIMIFLLKRKNCQVPVRFGFHFDRTMIKRILYIGIPNGLENSIFQLGKLMLSSLIASFGTMVIAANAVAGSVGGLATIPATATGMAMLTVVGQCVGAEELLQARKYMWKLTKITYVCLLVLNMIIIIFLPQICRFYGLSAETALLAERLLAYNSVCCILIYPLAFPLANGLRAANDVRYTMVVSIFSMWTFRIVLGYYMGRYLGMGVMGVWIAMTVDWLVRALFFGGRVLSGKWERYARLSH